MKKQLNEKEVRIANLDGFEFEAKEDENKLVIEGYAAVFNERTLIGSERSGFYETIMSNAFGETDLRDVPLKYNHCDTVPILARTRNKSLELSVDDKGLFIRASLLDTQDNLDMYKRVKAGLIDKMSFAFTIADDGENWEERDGVYFRTISKIDRLFDVSVVDIPAYEGTSIYARSIDKCETYKALLDSRRAKNYGITTLVSQYTQRKKG